MKDVTYDIVTSTPLSEVAPNFFCGIVYGRHVTVEYLPNRNVLELRLGTAGLSSSCKNRLRNLLSKYFTHPDLQLQLDEHTICAVWEAKDAWLDFLTHLIDVIDEACASLDLKSGCFLCGECTQDISAKQIGTMHAYMCAECSDRLNHEMRKALKEKHEDSRFTMYANSNIEVREDFTMGILGALAGTLAGAILWFFLFRIPYVGYAISGFVLAFLILFGYKVLAKSISIKGLLSCTGIFIITFLLCFNLTQSMFILQTLQNTFGETDVSLGNVFTGFFGYIFDDRFRNDLIDDFMIGILGATIAFGLRLFMYYRED